MYHPLDAIPRGRRLAPFLYLLAGTVVLSLALRFVGPFAPTIVDFEFAGTVVQVTGILTAWDAVAKLRAGFNLGLDYLYMPVYSTTIALACVWGARVLKGKVWNGIGIMLAWGLWLAAIFDAVENYALVTMLFGTIVDPYPQVAQVCAVFKFSLILLGLVYCALAAVIRIGLLLKTTRKAS
jgi:hypothetical protein